MPTGYTYLIEEKANYSLREYLEHCTHALGLLYYLRDENSKTLPDSIPCSNYKFEKLVEAKADLDNFVKSINLKNAYNKWVTKTQELNRQLEKDFNQK